MLPDLRFAWRALWRNPLVTAAALLTLGLGIGANTALFSVVYKILIEPLPFHRPDRLVMLWESDTRRGRNENVVSTANFLDWQRRSSTIAAMAAGADQSATLNGDVPEQVYSQRVTPLWMNVLGVHPLRGRTFVEADSRPGAPAVIVLSESLWRRKYAGDPAIVGKQIAVDNTSHQVVGVVAEPFAALNHPAEIWQPLTIDTARDYRQLGRSLRAIGRLKDGETVASARAEMTGIASQLQREYPAFNTNWSINVVALSEQFSGPFRSTLWLLLGAGLTVLLIACVNVANLILARAAGRRREFAVRLSLGAGRWKLVRQLLVETTLLGLLGGVCGLLVAVWSIDGLKTLLPANFPRLEAVALQPAVLAFSMGTALAAGLLMGVFPALLHGLEGLSLSMREGSAGSGSSRMAKRLRDGLVVTETALTIVLLAAASLFTQSLLNLRSVPTGFDPQNVLTLTVSLGGDRYREPAARYSYFEEAARRAAAVPGVESASAIAFLPFSGAGAATGFHVAGAPEPAPGTAPIADVRVVLRGYMDTMRIPLRAGRLFQPEDFQSAGPVRLLVNEALARQTFPGENPLGRKLLVSMQNPNPGEIVGVVADTRHGSLTEPVRPMVYYPYPQLAFPFMTFAVRASGDVRAIQAQVEAAIRSVDPTRALASVRTMEEYLARAVRQNRAQSWLLGSFSGLALLLTVVGVCGVLMLSVTRNLREIGIRLALGARPAHLLRKVVGEGLALVGIGAGLGVTIALALAASVEKLLFGVSARDPRTIAASVAILLVCCGVSSLLPALRAVRVDPAVVLRQDG